MAPTRSSRTWSTWPRCSPAPERYSFSFDGNAQTLDHVLVNEALVAASRASARPRAHQRRLPGDNRNDANSPLAPVRPRPGGRVLRAASPCRPVGDGLEPMVRTPAARRALRRDARATPAPSGDRPGLGFAVDAELPDLAVTAPARLELRCGDRGGRPHLGRLQRRRRSASATTARFAVDGRGQPAHVGRHAAHWRVAQRRQSLDPVHGNDTRHGGRDRCRRPPTVGAARRTRRCTCVAAPSAGPRCRAATPAPIAAPQVLVRLTGDAPAAQRARAVAAGLELHGGRRRRRLAAAVRCSHAGRRATRREFDGDGAHRAAARPADPDRHGHRPRARGTRADNSAVHGARSHRASTGS